MKSIQKHGLFNNKNVYLAFHRYRPLRPSGNHSESGSAGTLHGRYSGGRSNLVRYRSPHCRYFETNQHKV